MSYWFLIEFKFCNFFFLPPTDPHTLNHQPQRHRCPSTCSLRGAQVAWHHHTRLHALAAAAAAPSAATASAAIPSAATAAAPVPVAASNPTAGALGSSSLAPG